MYTHFDIVVGKMRICVCVWGGGGEEEQEQEECTHLFAYMFLPKKDLIVIGCQEERILNNTQDEYMGKKKFDANLYADQDFVRNQIRDLYADYKYDDTHTHNQEQDSNKN